MLLKGGNTWWILILLLLGASLSNATLGQIGGLIIKSGMAALSTATNEVNGLMGGSNSPQPPSELPGE